MSYYERCWHTHAHIRSSHVHMTTLWNEIPYTKKEKILPNKKKSEKINNFYVRQKHACLKARWMCQKKNCECLPLLRGGKGRKKFLFSFSIIIYFYALSRSRAKFFFSSLMKFRWCWALRMRTEKRKKFIYEMTVHRVNLCKLIKFVPN